MTAATEDQLIVQYYPGIGNVTNHFIIPVSEAAEGQWEIRCSSMVNASVLAHAKQYGVPPSGFNITSRRQSLTSGSIASGVISVVFWHSSDTDRGPEKPRVAFDMSQIERGHLLWGRHSTWSEGKWLSSSATIATPPLEAFSLFTCPFQCIRRFPVRLAGGSPGADAV